MSHLVSYLRDAKKREDRATLAALRRGVGKAPGEAPEMFPHLIPRIPEPSSRWAEQCHYLVASLFALHPLDWTGEASGWTERNFGSSARRLKAASKGSEGPERRFVALLGAHMDDIGSHLRSMVGLLKANDVPVDWE
jgi:CRISPR system Cascade subunit CasB